jgi:MFS family permease
VRRRLAQGRPDGGQAGAISGALGGSGLLGPAGVFTVLALGALDLGLEQSIVLPALPVIAVEQQATPDSVTWLVTGYLLAQAVALPLFARLGDLLGRRRLVVASLTAFAAGSLICAHAGSLAGLVAGRVVQGVGAAVAVLGVGIIRDHLAPRAMPVAVGVLVAGAGAGYAVGLVVGGWLVDRASVAAIFWFLFGVAAALLLAVIALVPRSGSRARGPVDWMGAGVLAAGAATLLLGVSKGNDWGWSSGRTVSLLCLGVGLLVAFCVLELRIAHPLVDVRLMARRTLASANLAALAVGFGLFIAGVTIPQLASLPPATGYGLGLTATETGLLLLPGALAILAFGALGGRLVPVLGPRAVVGIGAACGTLAYAALAVWHDGVTAVAAANGLLGAGVGLSVAAIATLVVTSVEPSATSGSVGVNALIRTIGAALGAQMAAAIVTAAGLVQGLAPEESGFTEAFVLGAAASAAAVLAATLLPSPRREPAVLPV